MNKNPLNKGVLTENFRGIGPVTRAMVQARAQELAVCHGIINDHAAELMERFDSPSARPARAAGGLAPGWALSGAAA